MATVHSYDAEQRRRVLQTFIDRNKLKVQTWTNASGLSESVVRHFLSGITDSMGDRTYTKLAIGATKLLEREITAAALRGEAPPVPTVPIFHYVGAGDEIHIVEGSEPMDWTEAPPGYEKGGAGIVRGDSMRPLFENADVLFWRHLEPPPAQVPRRAVVVKVKDGPLFVKKLLPGTRKGRYHLVSVNPITPVLEDQPVEAIARIGWVKPVE
jgi:phage repressor protein C with HTH and peptisase S24 domain